MFMWRLESSCSHTALQRRVLSWAEKENSSEAKPRRDTCPVRWERTWLKRSALSFRFLAVHAVVGECDFSGVEPQANTRLNVVRYLCYSN